MKMVGTNIVHLHLMQDKFIHKIDTRYIANKAIYCRLIDSLINEELLL